MPTDDERREVARRLRNEAKFGWCIWVGSLRDALGVDGETSGQDILNRLADLIEPQTSKQTNPRESSLSASLCDRDALLELAEEMVETFRLGAFTGEGLGAKWCRELHDKYARRIREALG